MIPKDHKAFGCDWEELRSISVHGGVTYSEPNLLKIELPQTWWIGFDCAHGGDDEPGGRSLRYVIAECFSLARQLTEFNYARPHPAA